LSVIFLVFSCKKPEDRTCFKLLGPETTKEIPLASFDRLDLREHVEYILIQDSLDKVVLKGGRNLLNLIEASVSDGLLTIENNNRCNFLRNAKKVVVAEIHFTSLINIRFIGTEPLRSQGTIHTDYLTFYSRDGAGDVILDVNAIEVNAEANLDPASTTTSGRAAASVVSRSPSGVASRRPDGARPVEPSRNDPGRAGASSAPISSASAAAARCMSGSPAARSGASAARTCAAV
jgi:hypothetical protein